MFRSCFNRVTLALSRIRKGRPIVHLYAVCKNEAHIIPYFLNHYGAFVDTFIIYDNGSTDKSLKLLHYKYIDRELVLNRHRQNRENMSPSNKKHGWGVHYMTSDEEAVAKYDALLAQSEIVV
ncbi:MAG: hypothetical protein GX804_09915 [Lentisphaerae bacterium]|nr:hypothetical protein [Lentisphaerota bacterium]